MMKRALLAIAAVSLVGFAANTASADYCPRSGGYGYGGGYRAPYVGRSAYYGTRVYPGGYGYRGYGYRGYGYGARYGAYGNGYGRARYGYPGSFYGRSGIGYYGNGVSFRINF